MGETIREVYPDRRDVDFSGWSAQPKIVRRLVVYEESLRREYTQDAEQAQRARTPDVGIAGDLSHYSANLPHFNGRDVRAILEQAPKGKRVVDIGCGMGQLFLTEEIKGKFDAVGITHLPYPWFEFPEGKIVDPYSRETFCDQGYSGENGYFPDRSISSAVPLQEQGGIGHEVGIERTIEELEASGVTILVANALGINDLLPEASADYIVSRQMSYYLPFGLEEVLYYETVRNLRAGGIAMLDLFLGPRTERLAELVRPYADVFTPKGGVVIAKKNDGSLPREEYDVKFLVNSDV